MIEGDVLKEAMIRWRTQNERGDITGKQYFEGGMDSIIMIAQMFGLSEEWIQKELIE